MQSFQSTMQSFTTLSVILAVLVSLCTSVELVAAGEKVIVGRAVPKNELVSMDRIDQAAWTALLQKYVNQSGQVNYASWQASSDDTRRLDTYLHSLSRASRTTAASRSSQLAFWINAYNALTIWGILREYPTSSIRNHTARFVGYNIWHDLLLMVGNTRVSLDDIEHKILRTMDEPRIHFAVVCASHSCPRLLDRAYTASRLEQQLMANAKVFFANAENFQYRSQLRQFQLSSILNWYADDFGRDQATRLKTISPYLPTREAFQAAITNSVRVSYLKYDWSLNEQKAEPNVGAQRDGTRR